MSMTRSYSTAQHNGRTNIDTTSTLLSSVHEGSSFELYEGQAQYLPQGESYVRLFHRLLDGFTADASSSAGNI
ncbi:hypothetical protein GCK32_012850 [Trichostrongylus colubriformis]|uniref:Uncharacterized protein n=1 Tax=Trichostrongylus colubriformis TaxID=6319 RepID=A0AAN8EZ81_TRICO